KWIPLSGAITFMMDVDWSPAGDWLLFVSLDEKDRASLWIVRPDGSGQQKLLEEESRALSAHWGPTGDVIYCLKGDTTQELWKLPIYAKSGKPQGAPPQVLGGLESGANFDLFRDGSRLAYIRSTAYSNLWLATKDGGSDSVQVTELTKGTL